MPHVDPRHAAGAVDPAARLPGRTRAVVTAVVVPGAITLAALAVLLYGGFRHVGTAPLCLAAATIVGVIVRGGWSFHQHASLLDRARRDSVTDQLTGLGNRRIMTADLDHVLALGADAPEAVLVMFDLDGFKVYNDRFGHLAGDALLAHLGGRLQSAVADVGAAYRPGGDEFGVLLRHDLEHREDHVAAAVAALSADGEGFTVSASCGRVQVPAEAHTPTEALRLADDRVYSQKDSRRGLSREQTHDVLLGLLRERRPDLHDYRREIGRLSVLVGAALGMNDEELDDLRQAAELHDIGKAAIPGTILDKPGPLTEHEWAFMRRSPVVGERILAAAPAWAPVAALVRSSYERWDGTGYPDGLAGEAVPLGARVVSVCDAFASMTRARPYAAPVSLEDALAELRRGAGSQFDPRVVEAFVTAHARRFDALDGRASLRRVAA